METPHDDDIPLSDAEIIDAVEEGAASSALVTSDRAERYYDKWRRAIRRYLDNKGSVVGTAAEYLLLVPDFFMLLWRLINDPRVEAKNKVLLGSGIAYYIFPFDIIPEGFLGPIGLLDDLVFAVYMLNKILADTNPAILREHWSGEDDVLVVIQRVLAAADHLVGTELLGRLKKLTK
ncbi:MAG TPA: DUF1232 domain-containing protein [Thermoanaerobaculia bacterium]|nr:DUF1232 domain-containing protein [Thermoanaerobaculia bacterium]